MDAFLNLEGGIRFVLDWILRQMMGKARRVFSNCGGSEADTARLPAA